MRKTLSLLTLAISLYLSLSAQNIHTIAGTGVYGYSGDGGTATMAELNDPYGIAVDVSGNVYVADLSNNRIRKITAAGVITTFAGNGFAGHSGDGGAATLAELHHPTGVAVDHMGNVYIADGGNNCIRKVDAGGTITAFAGDGGIGYSGDGGAATLASFGYARRIATDDMGNLYVCDAGNNCIRKVDTYGFISTIIGTGTAGYSGDGGPAISAELNGPISVAVDGIGNIYITEYYNECVRRVNPSGIISTIAGVDSIAGYTGDGGPAILAELDGPYGVAADSRGNVYIADAFNNCIRKISPSGIITTIAGTGTGGFTGDGGPAAIAELYHPFDMAIDTGGNIYFPDAGNERIRIITPDRAPYFIYGATHTDTVCSGISLSINSLLAADDSDAGQMVTWSLNTAPLHGAAIVADTITSTGDTLDPSGLTYTPAAAYSGTDSFEVKVSDGTDSIFTMVYVMVLPAADAGVITGAAVVCQGDVTLLTDTAAGGIWYSRYDSIATVAGSGIVTGLIAGVDTISYTVANACGNATDRKAIRVLTTAECDTILTVNAISNNGAEGVTIYPNPSDGIFTVAIPVTSGVTSISIYDVYGKLAAVKEVISGNRLVSFDLNNMPRGTYVIVVKNGAGVYRGKVVLY